MLYASRGGGGGLAANRWNGHGTLPMMVLFDVRNAVPPGRSPCVPTLAYSGEQLVRDRRSDVAVRLLSRIGRCKVGTYVMKASCGIGPEEIVKVVVGAPRHCRAGRPALDE